MEKCFSNSEVTRVKSGKVEYLTFNALEKYKDKILALKMSYKQKAAVQAIFEQKAADIMAQNMGFKPKET